MNKVILMGRLTKDPDVRYSQGSNGNTAIARYTLAVERKYKNADGKYDADFVNCIAFKAAGEFAEKYFHKGMKIVVSGRIQTGSYTNNDGQKVYTTDIVIEEQEFAESKSAGNREARDMSALNDSGYNPSVSSDGFMNIPDGIDEDLPFN